MTEQNYAPNFNDDLSVDGTPEINDAGVLAGSPLDRLGQVLAEDTRTENYHHRIPKRRILRVILDPNIDGDKFQAWQRRATQKGVRADGTGSNIDAMRLASIVVGNQMVGLEIATKDGGWEEAYDDNGEPLTFRSPRLREMLAPGNTSVSASELVKKLFGNDGHLLECSRVLVEKAGYGDDSESEDDDPLE